MRECEFGEVLRKLAVHTTLTAQTFCRAVGQRPLKCEVHITFDPAIPLLGIYRKGTLSRLCTRARVRVCRAALFVIPQNRGNSYIPFMDQGSISWVTASQWTAQQLGCQCHGRMCVLHSDRGPILSTELRTCLHPQKCWSGKCSERLYQMFTLQSPLGSCWGRRDGMC